MTQKNRDKTAAREMQTKTGWPYARCLKVVRETRAAAVQITQSDVNAFQKAWNGTPPDPNLEPGEEGVNIGAKTAQALRDHEAKKR
jgi:hypothetical protein